MISRIAEKELIKLSEQFKAVAVVGPRQSGKTTLVRKVFAHKPYVNLENPDVRHFALSDPRGFLAQYKAGAVLDEIQRTPELFSYLQQVLDESVENGLFILTGSNNFLLQENISQSLAGRIAYLFLLPLSFQEIPNKNLSINELLVKGSYPGLITSGIDSETFFSNYIRTYIERDVRLIKNISDLYLFERFIRLCAARIGQLLNMSNLAVEVGVDSKTIATWISVLESSFILFRLQPFFKNYNKRIVKMPKLFFYDTGLAAALMGIYNPEQLHLHPFRGSLFENFIVTEFIKDRFNKGKASDLYFWRDNTGHEIDLVIERNSQIIPIEIKSGQTVTNEYFKPLQFFSKIAEPQHCFVVYAGNTIQNRSDGISVIPYNELGSTFFGQGE